MERVSVSSKGQVVIPKAIRQRLNLRPGTQLEVELVNDTLTLKLAPTLPHKERVARLVGMFRRPGRRRSMSIAEMDAAVLRMALEADERTKTKPRRKGKRR